MVWFWFRPLRKATLLWLSEVTGHWSSLEIISTWSLADEVAGRTFLPTSPPQLGWLWSATERRSLRLPTGEITSSRLRWTPPQVMTPIGTNLISSFCLRLRSCQRNIFNQDNLLQKNTASKSEIASHSVTRTALWDYSTTRGKFVWH